MLLYAVRLLLSVQNVSTLVTTWKRLKLSRDLDLDTAHCGCAAWHGIVIAHCAFSFSTTSHLATSHFRDTHLKWLLFSEETQYMNITALPKPHPNQPLLYPPPRLHPPPQLPPLPLLSHLPSFVRDWMARFRDILESLGYEELSMRCPRSYERVKPQINTLFFGPLQRTSLTKLIIGATKSGRAYG